jgi:hypothetical protein
MRAKEAAEVTPKRPSSGGVRQTEGPLPLDVDVQGVASVIHALLLETGAKPTTAWALEGAISGWADAPRPEVASSLWLYGPESQIGRFEAVQGVAVVQRR